MPVFPYVPRLSVAGYVVKIPAAESHRRKISGVSCGDLHQCLQKNELTASLRMKVDENKAPTQLSQQRMIFLMNKFLDITYDGLKFGGKCCKLTIDNPELSVVQVMG